MKYTVMAFVLCFFATVKVLANIMGFETLAAVAAVTNVAPAMKVFTAHKSYETYSAIFKLTVVYKNGQQDSIQLNPENYSGLKGPYNRRNVYGALIAYGPLLVSNPKTQAMWNTMANRAFCRTSGVLTELGFNNNSGVKQATIHYLRQIKSKNLYPTKLSISCD